MILQRLSIKNYRSIYSIKDLKFSKTLTTFIGKNNQGKTNILKAINLVFSAIIYIQELHTTKRIPWRKEINYDWDVDFPIQRQDKSLYQQYTTIKITLELDNKEISELNKLALRGASSLLNIELRLHKERIRWMPDLRMKFKGFKQEYKLEDDGIAENICSWLLTKMKFQYIPAIRTDKLADEIANNIITLQLLRLAPQKREKLKAALDQIEELQKPILNNLEKNLSATLKDFVPEIKKVSLEENKDSSYRISRRYSEENDFYIKIDDGSDTSLYQKGDGIKSLITLGMMRQKGKTGIGKGLVLAIEEPESHLHPEAIRQISRVINDIAEQNQVIVTTHSPLFVNRNIVSDNIIVDNNTAINAINIKQIRDILGVIASDNLINSEFTIVVEGETDKNILYKFISKNSNTLHKLLEEKRICFEVLNGVNNLENSLNKLNNMSSKYFCILDSDQIANASIKSAINKSLLSREKKEVFQYTLQPLKECELEDLIAIEQYSNILLKGYNINLLKDSLFSKNKDKWSKKMKSLFERNGKTCNDDMLKKIKVDISNLNSSRDNFFTKNQTSSIHNLIAQLENYFINQ